MNVNMFIKHDWWKLLVLHVVLIAGVSSCNKKSESKQNTSLSDATDTSDSDLETLDDNDDSREAFPDIEEQDLLCQGYQLKPTHQALPQAVIFGTRKGGTRALLEFLNMHSLIRRSKPEIHFYDKHFDKGVNWYISQMPFITAGQIGMEKTPGYFHTAVVPKKMFDTKNDTKLLMIIRDPVKRLISDYNQFYHNNLDKGEEYPHIETFLSTSDGGINANYPPLRRSLYYKHMAEWLKYFPLEQFYIVDGDKFIKAPWKEIEKVENFLNLPNEVGEDNFYFNATKGFYCGKEIIENVNAEWTCTRNKCLSKSKGRKPPKMNQDLMNKLYDFFEPYNQKFFQLINRTDIHWAKPSQV